MLPGHPDHLMFVEDMTRNGLNLYFDSDIQRLSFKPMPKMMSDSSYDQTVAEALRENKLHRVFIMKRQVETYFLTELRNANKTPVLLGVLPELHSKLARDGLVPVILVRTTPSRVVYTVAGDFPEAASH
jgi:hypothetical protein